MLQKWQRLSRRTILQHPRMTVVEDTVLLPPGDEATYVSEDVSGHDSVAVIAVDGDKILIQREYSYPPNEIMYQLPGGGIERDEDVLTAANRELSEETGFVAKNLEVIGVYYMNNRRSNRKQYVVIAKDLVVEPREGDKEEFIENEWKTRAEIREMTQSGVALSGFMLAGLYFFDQAFTDTT